VDVKAEHFERQVQRVEQERDRWEKKYEVPNVAVSTVINILRGFDSGNRSPKPSIANPRQNWTTWSQAWKYFEFASPMDFPRRHGSQSLLSHNKSLSKTRIVSFDVAG
jgi:hypothetical protein